MQSIDTLLQEDDPIEMVLAEVFGQHPELAILPPDALTVSKILPHVGERNTEAVIVGLPPSGLKGKLSVFYDRADLNKVYNIYGDKLVNPKVFVAADVGSNVIVNDILPQINAALGLKLKTTGNFLDVQSFSFVAAAKNDKTTIALTAKNGTADGSPPVSARVLPGKQLKIDIVNRGSHINNKLLNRGLNPFVKTDGFLNWGGEAILAAAPKRSLLLKLFSVDFSDIFAQYQEPQWMPYAGYGFSVHKWLFKPEIATAIKERCAFLDIPIIDFTAAQQSGRAGTAADYMTAFVFKQTTAYPSAVHVNKKFGRVILIGDSFASVPTPVGVVQNVKPTIEARIDWAVDFNNYPIHFNIA